MKFRLAKVDELEEVFKLYVKRVKWMDEVGLKQWNVTDYLNVYPIAYYSKKQQLNELYVLLENNQIISAVVLLEEDERWLEKKDEAYYIHNLVTDPIYKGAGKETLKQIDNLARLTHKEYLRLDCAVDNETLNNYYSSLGYEITGTCEDGLYYGNKREKKL